MTLKMKMQRKTMQKLMTMIGPTKIQESYHHPNVPETKSKLHSWDNHVYENVRLTKIVKARKSIVFVMDFVECHV